MIVRTTCLHAKVRVFPACGEVHHLSGKRVWVVTFLPSSIFHGPALPSCSLKDDPVVAVINNHSLLVPAFHPSNNIDKHHPLHEHFGFHHCIVQLLFPDVNLFIHSFRRRPQGDLLSALRGTLTSKSFLSLQKPFHFIIFNFPLATARRTSFISAGTFLPLTILDETEHKSNNQQCLIFNVGYRFIPSYLDHCRFQRQKQNEPSSYS